MGPDAGDRLEELRLRNGRGDVLDVAIQCADERTQARQELQMTADESTLLIPELRQRVSEQPLLSSAGEQVTPRGRQPVGMQLAVNPIDQHRPLPDECGAMPNQRRPFPLARGRGIHLGDQPGQSHTREQLGIDVIALVVGFGDRAQPARMRQDERHAGARQAVVQPGPRRTGFHDRVQRAIGREHRQQLLGATHRDSRRTEHALAHPVDDDHDEIPCVSIDSCEKHVGLLVGAHFGSWSTKCTPTDL